MSILFGNSETAYYKDNILYYISGFVVRKIILKTKCQDCIFAIIASDQNLSPYTQFTDFITKGKLIRAHDDVFRIVKYIYNSLVVQYTRENNCNSKQIVIDTCSNFMGSVFKMHISNGSFGEDTHEFKLIQLISHVFCKVYCHHVAKENTIAVTSSIGLRQKLTKLILFKNV